MTEEQMRSIFCLAGFSVGKAYRLENDYWPNCVEYDDIRRKNPWWLAQTDWGLIQIGWRKRVISIDWEATEREYIITDDVTKGKTFCHAWSYPKAIEYLSLFRANGKLKDL